MSERRRTILLHQARDEGDACFHCGDAQPWPEMDPCTGSFAANVARLNERLAAADAVVEAGKRALRLIENEWVRCDCGEPEHCTQCALRTALRALDDAGGGGT